MPHLVKAASLHGLIYLGAMTAVAGAPNGNSQPSKLLASIEGFTGPSYRVEMVDVAHVAYFSNRYGFTVWEGTKKVLLKIPPESWIRFRGRLDAAHVWKWKPEYVDKRVADGTVWKLEVEYGDRRVSSHGRNAYPDKKQFEEFCAAVRELIRNRPFK